MLDNIPDELKQLRQFVCWKYEDIGAAKPTKVPYSPVTGYMANVNDPSTWVSFDEAKAYAHNYSGIGLVLTKSDPYCVMDLDDTQTMPNGQPNPNWETDFKRQKTIFTHFDSYAELSPGGKGVHIFVKANIEAGRRRSFIELYSSQRYITMTGNVINAKPIIAAQEKTDALWEQMGAPPQTVNFNGHSHATYEDDDILNQAADASNGEKFKDLWFGNWQQYYQSQSEADFAFIDIVAFYSKNKEQIIRLFHRSALGQRDKAKRVDYVNWMVNKSFDRMLPPIDIDGFKNALELKIARLNAASSNGRTAPFEGVNLGSSPRAAAIVLKDPTNDVIPVPPGLMGEIANFIYNAAPRPVPEIAIAGAIGLMAGIVGRAYNYSKTGLNQYILLLANTGRGKEAISTGIDLLMNPIKAMVPATKDLIGPGDIASGQALIKHLSKSPSKCFVSVIGEFGIRLHQMSTIRATPSENALKRNLLDLYNKSGYGKSVKPTVYSDKEKDTLEIDYPSVTIVGESTPARFYENLNEDMIIEGLLSRFTIIEYLGMRPPLNEHHDLVKPDPKLLQTISDVAVQALKIMNNKTVINVRETAEAKQLFDSFNDHCDKLINENLNDGVIELWNRGDMKAKKLAALVAVGVNYLDPIITKEHAEWAINITHADISRMVGKFERGEIGSDDYDAKQIKELHKAIKKYLTCGYEQIKMYDVRPEMHNDRIIPYSYLSRRLVATACFRKDRLGSTGAIKKAVQNLIDADEIREIPRSELTIKYGARQRCFMVSNMEILN